MCLLDMYGWKTGRVDGGLFLLLPCVCSADVPWLVCSFWGTFSAALFAQTGWSLTGKQRLHKANLLVLEVD